MTKNEAIALLRATRQAKADKVKALRSVDPYESARTISTYEPDRIVSIDGKTPAQIASEKAVKEKAERDIATAKRKRQRAIDKINGVVRPNPVTLKKAKKVRVSRVREVRSWPADSPPIDVLIADSRAKLESLAIKNAHIPRSLDMRPDVKPAVDVAMTVEQLAKAPPLNGVKLHYPGYKPDTDVAAAAGNEWAEKR